MGAAFVAEGFRFAGKGEAITGFTRYDELQDDHRIVRVEEPGGSYYVLLDRELIVQALQDTESFSSRAVTPLQANPIYTIIPIMLDPPEHTKWRRLLAEHFAVRRIPLLDARIRERCSELLDSFAGVGSCEYVGDFAFRFPTSIFLEIMGLPGEELDTFLAWEREILYPTTDGSFDQPRRIAAVMKVFDRFREVIAERRSSGVDGDDGADIVSQAVRWEIDGSPVGDDQLLSCCLLLFMAGLDTVANELAFATWHLATHPDDRAWLAADPSPRSAEATEELLRTFSIGQVARKVRRDVVVGGVELAAGDMVVIPLAAANRDPAHTERAREADLGREPRAHYAFGAGPHRCLGSHLARREIAVALELWHERIPEYSLASDSPVEGHWGNVHGVSALPLQWGRCRDSGRLGAPALGAPAAARMS